MICKAIELLSEGEWEHDLSRLARRCNVSEAYLSRLFGRQIGVPLSRYRNSLRLSRFWIHYRKSGRKNLTEAAYAAGFGSYAQFYKIFAQTYGCGPRDSPAHRSGHPSLAPVRFWTMTVIIVRAFLRLTGLHWQEWLRTSRACTLPASFILFFLDRFSP